MLETKENKKNREITDIFTAHPHGFTNFYIKARHKLFMKIWNLTFIKPFCEQLGNSVGKSKNMQA